MPEIVCDNVGRTFQSNTGDVEALASVSFSIKPGETCVIVGPSGCGKSTLLRIVAGLDSPTMGKVSVSGGGAERAVGYVPQAVAMLPWRTALQNAAIGHELRVPRGQQIGSEVLDDLTRWFAEFGLTGFENADWDSLSGGMKQRVSLICALSISPSLLFGDEPFSAIDYESRLGLLSRFKRTCRDESLTSVIVTHDIEEAIFLADRVIVLSARPGTVVADIDPRLPPDTDDAVEARNLKVFREAFSEIWSHLKRAVS